VKEKLPKHVLRDKGLKKCAPEQGISVIELGEAVYRLRKGNVIVQYWAKSGTAQHDEEVKTKMEPPSVVSWIMYLVQGAELACQTLN
jgi:hypothetical protein